MKIKNIAAVLLLIWTCGFSSVVSAAEIQTVQLTEENQLVYTKDKTELAGAFDGMVPGDSRTVVIGSTIAMKIKTIRKPVIIFFTFFMTHAPPFFFSPQSRQSQYLPPELLQIPSLSEDLLS